MPVANTASRSRTPGLPAYQPTHPNTAANPNISANFVGIAPTNASYGSTAGNGDNVPYPHFMDNQSLVSYQSLGILNVNISNYDDGSGAVMPACPNYYDVIVTSVPRGTNEAWVNYTAGGASFDLLQGLYLVKVFVSGAGTPSWQEQVAIVPNTLTTRNVTLSGINSNLAATSTMTVYENTAGVAITVASGSSDKFTVTGVASGGGATGINASVGQVGPVPTSRAG